MMFRAVAGYHEDTPGKHPAVTGKFHFILVRRSPPHVSTSVRFARFALVLTLLTPAASALFADTVVLKNGDKLTGTVVKLEDGKLTVKTAYADALPVSWDQVVSFTTDEPLVLPQTSGI